LLAIAVSAAMGLSFDWLIGKPLPFVREATEGFGFGLAGTYLITAIVVIILYFPCRWFAGLKQRRTEWWISYF